MESFNADLHLHSPYSIGVSPRMTIPELAKGARMKGLDILGTGDATQPDWLGHLSANLERGSECYTHKGINFIITTEIEDCESIHHLIILPDIDSAEELRGSLRRHTSDIDGEWAGRPRVDIDAETLAEVVQDLGGLIGPAHAFTPYRSIFREGRYESLVDCYRSQAKNIHFLELGLSADSSIGDYISELHRLTFLTCSDAHSPTPLKLGREYVRFNMEAPSFQELCLAIIKKGGRKPTLNVGFDPRLGKYFLSFCSGCRRTLILNESDAPPSLDDLNVYLHVDSPDEIDRLLTDIHARKVKCPACGKSLRLGVRDRALMIGSPKSHSPENRPPYVHMPPLLELISVAFGMKSRSSKTARDAYYRLVTDLGTEASILTEVDCGEISGLYPRVGRMVDAYRRGEVEYRPGGGGRYGQVVRIPGLDEE